MTWKTIFNPFGRLDDKHLLIVGILFFILNIFGCYYAGNVNDSIFHLSHLEDNQTIWDVMKINSLSSVLAIIVLYILALFLNNRTRIIDIINTVLISAIPLIIIMPISGMSFLKNATQSITKNVGDPSQIETINLILVTAFALATLPFMIYSFVLYYNGFKTATNIKKWQHVVLFVIASFILTIVSQTIF
ncbi:YIP1 family protein [Epilithonimonas sp.]|uniref:YIP1 family protein n=1 Tax=Epilithonimonas sp. TaxID=2894511 RepID=UPI002896DA0C|nr:YIP1 family protein [Epilithonimonas sp.]